MIEHKIREILEQEFSPESLTIKNDSHKHTHHLEGGGEESHFTINITAAAFAGLTVMQRHKAVYKALDSIIPQIHALSLKTDIPR